MSDPSGNIIGRGEMNKFERRYELTSLGVASPRQTKIKCHFDFGLLWQPTITEMLSCFVRGEEGFSCVAETRIRYDYSDMVLNDR